MKTAVDIRSSTLSVIQPAKMQGTICRNARNDWYRNCGKEMCAGRWRPGKNVVVCLGGSANIREEMKSHTHRTSRVIIVTLVSSSFSRHGSHRLRRPASARRLEDSLPQHWKLLSLNLVSHAGKLLLHVGQ